LLLSDWPPTFSIALNSREPTGKIFQSDVIFIYIKKLSGDFRILSYNIRAREEQSQSLDLFLVYFEIDIVSK
jgi:hypothetical protein